MEATNADMIAQRKIIFLEDMLSLTDTVRPWPLQLTSMCSSAVRAELRLGSLSCRNRLACHHIPRTLAYFTSRARMVLPSD